MTKLFVITVKGFEPATSCVSDQDATAVPARHKWKTRSLNWVQFMLQWFTRFPEIFEFNESSAPQKKHLLGEKWRRNLSCWISDRLDFNTWAISDSRNWSQATEYFLGETFAKKNYCHFHVILYSLIEKPAMLNHPRIEHDPHDSGGACFSTLWLASSQCTMYRMEFPEQHGCYIKSEWSS